MICNAIASAARPVLNAVCFQFVSQHFMRHQRFLPQRTATTLSAGFPKVTQRVRTLPNNLHFNMHALTRVRLAADQVWWCLHCTFAASVHKALHTSEPDSRSPLFLVTVLAMRSPTPSRRSSSMSTLPSSGSSTTFLVCPPRVRTSSSKPRRV